MNGCASNPTATPHYNFSLSLTNNQHMVPDLLMKIRQWMVGIGVPQNKITNIQIVVAEALNNIIEHGFSIENFGTIDIQIEVDDDSTVVELMDNGKKFTPPNISKTPLIDSTDFENLPEGGFGWFLITEITSSFELQRHLNMNKLILRFR